MQSCRAALILLCLSTAVPAIAQQQEQPEKPRQVRSVVIYGDDPCPEGKEGEIIVCARKPESERYRVPEEVRKAPQPPPRGAVMEGARRHCGGSYPGHAPQQLLHRGRRRPDRLHDRDAETVEGRTARQTAGSGGCRFPALT